MSYVIEKYGPILAAAMSVAALFYFREKLTAASLNSDIDFSNLYSAVFDWSAIQTGFLFGIFGYVGGKTTGFIAEIRNTDEMASFVRYMKVAIALGFTLTFFSVPLIVASFKMHGSTLALVIFCIWAFLSVWGFFAFARVAYLFGLLIRPRDQQRIPA